MKGLVITALLVLCANAAQAVTVTEIGDFDNGASFISTGESNIGLLDVGINTISGSMAGDCVIGDCNGASAGDTQDSFRVEVAPGFKIDSVIATTSNVNGPAGFGTNLFVYKDAFSNLVLAAPLSIDSTTASLFLTSSDAGDYSFSVTGGGASVAGPFSLDYSLQIEVSAVPIPAAAWLFGSAILGLVAVKRRKA